MSRFARYLPILDWGRSYNTTILTNDLVAAGIVTIMLIPQSLAYAMLAGLPPEVGLYASILPIIAYALFGTSRTLAVGPVAVISLMTLTAASSVAAPGSAQFIAAALILAFLSGVMLTLMGVLYHPDPSRSVAVLSQTGSTRRIRARVGDRVGGIRIVSIGPRSVDLIVEEFGVARRETLELRPTSERGSSS